MKEVDMFILSSQDFYNRNSKEFIIEHINKPLEQCKVLFFPNQNAKTIDIKSRVYHFWIRDLGFSFNNIYVFDYENLEQFKDLDIDIIYVGGGNTFETLDRLRKSQADKLIAKYVAKGITYIGGSAGAHIVTKSVEYVKGFDKVPDGFSDFSGLGLVDGIIFCHYSESRKNAVDKALSEGKYNVIAVLRDDDSIVIDE